MQRQKRVELVNFRFIILTPVLLCSYTSSYNTSENAYSGTLRTGTSSLRAHCPIPYTNAIVVSDFTIATR